MAPQHVLKGARAKASATEKTPPTAAADANGDLRHVFRGNSSGALRAGRFHETGRKSGAMQWLRPSPGLQRYHEIR